MRQDQPPPDSPAEIEHIRSAIYELENLKSESAESEQSEMDSWLLPYVDTITTLLALYAFFVSLMEYPQQKRTDVQTEIRKSFSIPALIDLPELKIEMEAQKYLPDEERLLRVIKSNGLERDVTINIANGTATLTIGDTILFAPGAAEISDQGETVLRALGPALDELPGIITVAGHTDESPISTETFKSNLDLSFARAVAVIELYKALKISEARFRAVANAATQPVADQSTDEGRRANRRVEISVDLNDQRPPAQTRR